MPAGGRPAPAGEIIALAGPRTAGPAARGGLVAGTGSRRPWRTTTARTRFGARGPSRPQGVITGTVSVTDPDRSLITDHLASHQGPPLQRWPRLLAGPKSSSPAVAEARAAGPGRAALRRGGEIAQAVAWPCDR